MAVKTRAQLKTANANLFQNNLLGNIEASDEKAYNDDEIDSFSLNSELFQDVTKSALAALIAGSEILNGTRYRITNATAGVVVVWGIDSNVISTNAYIEGNWDGSTFSISKTGNYKLNTDWFIPTDNIYAVAPTTAEDSTKGYAVGDYWVDSVTNIQYQCTDATAAAAVWQAQSGDDITFPGWTPSITPDNVNLTAVSLSGYNFFRSGNIVTVNCGFSVTMDFSAATTGIFTIDPTTLPIPSTTPTWNGIGQCEDVSTWPINCFIALGSGVFTIKSGSGAANTTYTVYFTFSYSVN